MEKDISEFVNICNELQLSVKELTSFVNNLIHKVESSPEDFIKDGLSILDVKHDTLLCYLINIVYLIFKKCSGVRIESDKAIDRCVESRVVLEKINPLEQKLKYQIEKLIKTSVTNEVDFQDKTHFKANPTNMDDSINVDSEVDEDDGVKKSKVKKAGEYVPPKLASVPYDDDNLATKKQKLLERAKKRALNSSVMQELKEEYLDMPVEISHTNTLRNTRLKYDLEKEKFEETYFTRIPVSKEEKRKRKLLSSFTLGQLGNDVTRFEDISALEGSLSSLDKKHKKRRSSVSNKNLKRGIKKRRTR